MGSRGAFEDSGLTGISPELREYSEIDRIDGSKVLNWDVGTNNRSPVYSNTANTVYYSYSSTFDCIERICFYENHRLVKTIDMEKHGQPAHKHKWSHAGTQVGRATHSKKNVYELNKEDMRYYNAAKKWNYEHNKNK